MVGLKSASQEAGGDLEALAPEQKGGVRCPEPALKGPRPLWSSGVA